MPEMLQDRLAFDFQSARRIDADGHLHVDTSNISMAAINPYLGREIPGGDVLGLKPDKIYNLLRDPDELKKAADTFNGKPLLSIHKAQSAAAHDHKLTVGSVSGVKYEHPYLKAALDVWDGDAIAGIESGRQKELSSGYRYEYDPTPGTYEGKPYDGVMRNICCNHVALVEKGRAGSDVVVGDSAIHPPKLTEILMTKLALTGKANLVKGALVGYLPAKLAQDTKLDFNAILKGVSTKTFKTDKPTIVTRLKAATVGKLAQDADLDDVINLLDALEDVDAGPDDTTGAAKVGDLPIDPDDVTDDASPDMAAIKSFLDGKMSDEDAAKLMAMIDPDADPVPPVVGDKTPKPVAITKAAMDAAIETARAAAVKDAVADTAARMKAVREAENIVRPYIGELAIAQDSAEGVFRLALDAMSVPHAEIKDVAALKAIVQMQPKPGAARKEPALAHDAAHAKSFAERFPNASRLVR